MLLVFTLSSDPGTNVKFTENPCAETRRLSYYICLLFCSQFKGKKIIATKANRWVGLDEKPLIADRRELEKMFQKKDGVHFVQLEERRQQSRFTKYGRSRARGKCGVTVIYHREERNLLQLKSSYSLSSDFCSSCYLGILVLLSGTLSLYVALVMPP